MYPHKFAQNPDYLYCDENIDPNNQSRAVRSDFSNFTLGSESRGDAEKVFVVHRVNYGDKNSEKVMCDEPVLSTPTNRSK